MGFWKYFWEFVGGAIEQGFSDIVKSCDEIAKGTEREAEWKKTRDNGNKAYEQLKKSAKEIVDPPKK